MNPFGVFTFIIAIMAIYFIMVHIYLRLTKEMLLAIDSMRLSSRFPQHEQSLKNLTRRYSVERTFITFLILLNVSAMTLIANGTIPNFATNLILACLNAYAFIQAYHTASGYDFLFVIAKDLNIIDEDDMDE